ncbi:MAG: CO dehydrogenase/CO-methylating acetyl-CoA synthase complex subunit beta [Candidatus Omnitrophica bacterium]|nr:CO dehydrogenase/CO-methylating acetyl-CoA synthase complex subunit beta [Candidatus Omnitrophota bacterium]
MPTLPQIPGARKKGVFLITSESDFKKLDSYLINDTVCISGPLRIALHCALLIQEKHKVGIKIVSTDISDEILASDIELISSPIQEIVGEGRAEAVKFKDGKAVGACLVLFVEGFAQDDNIGVSMPEALVQLGVKGSQAVLSQTQAALDKAIGQIGADAKIAFADTNYYFPLINALLNIEIKTLADCDLALKQAEGLSKNNPTTSGLNIASLGGILNKGVATLLCEEILAALAVASNEHPKGGIGFIPDNILRSLGLQLVDGRISGIAVILGPAKDEKSALDLIRNFQSRSIVSLLAGNINGNTFKQQLENQGVGLGLENYIVPLGDDYLSAIYAVNFAARAPLMYGGVKPGQWEGIADYIRNRVPAFVLVLSHVDELIVATGLGALALGLPIITDLEVPQLPKIDTTLFEALVTEKDYAKIVSKCILTRGIKVKISQVPVPLPYGAAFEGERVRKEQLAVEFGGKVSTAFEFLSIKDETSIDDGRVELIGPDVDQLPGGVKSLPLAIVVDVFGRKMQKDFEPILERQIHRFLNYAFGLMHMGQRDMVWIRISIEAFTKGFKLKHLGVILHAMLHQEYNEIVDKVQVRLYTNSLDVDRLVVDAKNVFQERDARLKGMTDESVDTFYSCLLCQSFAPNHVCIVTPERLGLCGAYSWLDAKASFEVIPTGPNQPIVKGSISNDRLGQWDSVNAFVQQKSNKTIDAVSMYSLMESPQSSCGCFECIVAIVPEANGVMVVHRDYSGLTPSGMSFTTLAGSVGGGVQTPGFLGVGKLYILSKKFISAEGGLIRVVWMPKELKELLADKLKMRVEEIGQPDLLNKIADETIAVSSEELLAFLEKVAHPALTMEPII